MRAPSELRRRKTRPNRGRIVLIVLAVALVLFITSLRGLAGFYTDYLWFDSLGMSGVFKHVLGAKVALALIFTGIFFLLCWLNLWIADRIAPRFRPAGPEEEFVERYQELIGRRTGLVRIVVSLLFGLIAGVGTSSQWQRLDPLHPPRRLRSEGSALPHRRRLLRLQAARSCRSS